MYEVIVERFFPPAPGGRGYSSERVAGKCETEVEAKIKVASLKNEHTGDYYISYRKMKEDTQSPIAMRNGVRREQIALIRQAQFHVGEALEKFKQATGKRPSITDKLGDLLVEMDLEMEMIHEEME